ncbi:hypothetical protein BZA77DRAFT_342841 [Pyronema omphalodes]|nr:hypothetical protein BZA77DRAFT_342841 [Pyronema omphalodes]
MDAFTISTGVAGFLSLALEISKILKSYVDGVKSAPEEAHTLLTNVTALCDVLEQLVRFLRKDYKGNFANTSAMAAAIEACKDQITQLYKKIENIEVSSDKSKITQVMERLKWPLRKEDYDNTISTVQRFTQTFQFSLTISNCELLAKTSEEVLAELKAREGQMKQTLESFGSMQFPGMESLLTESKKQMDFLGDVIKTLELGQETQQKILVVTQDTNRILIESVDQEMESLLQWISPLEPHTRHQDIRSKRLKNIGKWFLESEIFRNWQDKSHEVNIFGCYGIPGAGKTFISFAGDTSCVAYVYCDYQDRDEQTAVNMIGGLLKQAITGSSQKVSPDAIEPLLKKKKSRQAIEIQDAVSAFSGLIRCFDKTYICIDALDECNETDRRQLIQYLAELSSVSNQKDTLPVRLFFTGRPSMEKYVQSHTSIKPKIPLMVKLQASTEDIAAYIAHRISEDNMVGMDDDFKEHIIKEIVSASQNMFLLPALQIEAVLDEPTIRKRRKALQNMPRELYDVFGLTMDRIRAQKQSTSTLAMNVLQWIFLAARPLSLEELRHALSVEPGDTKLHGDNFVEAQFILDSCLGLVIVDESTSTVRLVHKALQDYFQEMYDEGSLFSEGHMEIASICMTYMAFDHFNQEVCTLKGEILDRYPLLGYAAVRWDYHLRSSKTRNTAVEDMAFTLVMEKYTSQLASNIFLTSRLEDRDYFFEMPESQLSNLPYSPHRYYWVSGTLSPSH